MRRTLPAWVSATLQRGAEACMVAAVAVTCGTFVESAALDRHQDQLARLTPKTIVPLSASLAQEPLAAPVQSRMASVCRPALSLAARDAARLVVTLEAPCAADTRVEISHAGMTFAVRMPIGRPLRLTLPALEASGQVSATLVDGVTAFAAKPVRDLADLRRFAVTATTADALRLQGGVGATEVLGSKDLAQPLLAQIYTYAKDAEADPVLAVQSSTALCGQSLIGKTISSRLGRAEATALRVDLSECGARPVVMHLKNLDQDVKVASR